MRDPLVSIIIPTHNRRLMVLKLLASVLKNSYKNVEIIVVDDCSSDNTEKAVRDKYGKNKKIKVIRNHTNLFTAESRNVGIRNAKGEYLFFIDDDNVLDIKAIEVLLDTFENDPKIGELGLVNYSLNKRKKILWAQTKRNMTTSRTYQSRNLKDFKHLDSWETDDVPNAFMVRKKIIKKYNIFFRAKYGIMYEESDFAYRIREKGYKIQVVRDAIIYHDVETAENNKINKDYMYHFMANESRPYVTSRNRIIFHSLFSSRSQFIFIITVWIWVFMLFYSYKIATYSGAGNFSLLKRLRLINAYMKGIIDGIFIVCKGIGYITNS